MNKLANVLVAEDNLMEAKLLRIAIRESGLDKLVDTVFGHDGESILESLRGSVAKPFDLLLLDLNMPRIPGIEVLGRIHADFPVKKPLIIILSNSDHKKDIEDCRTMGADAYFQKPAHFDELVAFCCALRDSLVDTGKFDIERIRKSLPTLS